MKNLKLTKTEAERLMTLLIRENCRLADKQVDEFTVAYFEKEKNFNRNLWARVYDLTKGGK